MKIDVIETLEGEIRLEYHGEGIQYKIYNETLYQVPESKLKKNSDLIKQDKKVNQEISKENRTNTEKFSKIIELRGYFESEELLTEEEKKITELRLEERLKKSREDNLETLTDSNDIDKEVV